MPFSNKPFNEGFKASSSSGFTILRNSPETPSTIDTAEFWVASSLSRASSTLSSTSITSS
uniref:5-oxoprolinase n=1 Tax=Rhizophora mucronata TaxID=61149 RepID=A0A2P2IKU1_RHIMU